MDFGVIKCIVVGARNVGADIEVAGVALVSVKGPSVIGDLCGRRQSRRRATLLEQALREPFLAVFGVERASVW